MRRLFVFALLPLVAACTTLPHPPPPPPPPELGQVQPGATVEVQILALNDFHGNLEPPQHERSGGQRAGAGRRRGLSGQRAEGAAHGQ